MKLTEELIRELPVSILVDLINEADNDLSNAGKPLCIQVNDSDSLDTIYEYLGDAYELLKAVTDTRFGAHYDSKDKYVLFDSEMQVIYSFSDREELFHYWEPKVIADTLSDIEIEFVRR